MKKYKLLIAVLITAPIAMLFALSFQNNVEATPTCPLDAQPGRTIMDFGVSPVVGYGLADVGALTTRIEDRNSFGPLLVNIPAGTYNITLVSFDNHLEVPDEEAQLQERWFLQGQNEVGNVVFESLAITDLSENQDLLEELVQEGVQIDQDITEWFATHFLGVGESVSAESVTPLCAAFDEVEENNFQ